MQTIHQLEEVRQGERGREEGRIGRREREETEKAKRLMQKEGKKGVEWRKDEL